MIWFFTSYAAMALLTWTHLQGKEVGANRRRYREPVRIMSYTRDVCCALLWPIYFMGDAIAIVVNMHNEGDA